MSGAFTVLNLPQLDVAHIEAMNTDMYIEDEHDVMQYLRAYELLCELALSPRRRTAFSRT